MSDLRKNEHESRALIRNEERLLLEMITKNPHKYTSETLKFIITSYDTKSAPNIIVEISKSFSELKIADQIHPLGWKSVGQVKCNGTFELSFELKRIINGFNCFFDIGEWFGLQFSKNGNACFLRFYDIFNDKKYHEITSKNLNLQQWYKENSSKYIFIMSIHVKYRNEQYKDIRSK